MQFSGGSLVQSLSQDYNPVSPGLQSSQGSLGVVWELSSALMVHVAVGWR